MFDTPPTYVSLQLPDTWGEQDGFVFQEAEEKQRLELISFLFVCSNVLFICSPISFLKYLSLISPSWQPQQSYLLTPWGSYEHQHG